ncbi:MAG: hypothetical protein KA136_01130 [Candidatus Bipolaricaulis sp.]|nr:hypothetical protein [Candidatus Bipolaricaulis sp.]
MNQDRHVRSRWWGLALAAMGLALTGCGLLDLLPELPPDQAPTGVTASLGQFEDRIEISWTAVAGATTYRVFRAESAEGTGVLIGETPSLVYSDPMGAADWGHLYWYQVAACNSAGCGPRSPSVPGYAGYLPAPTGVQASQIYADRIVVTWDPVPGATYYQVYRDVTPDGEFEIVANNVTATSFEDRTAVPGTLYYYRVRACHATGGSALSQPAPGRRVR